MGENNRGLSILWNIATGLGDASKVLIGAGAVCLFSGYVASLIFDIKLNKLKSNN